MFEHILDMEKKVDLANKHLVSYSSKSHQLMIGNLLTCECEYEQQSVCKLSYNFAAFVWMTIGQKCLNSYITDKNKDIEL